MLNFQPKSFVAIFVFFIVIVNKGGAKSLNDFENKETNPKEKKISKRSHIGVENDFGPPLIVSSSVLQLGKEHDADNYEPSEHFILSDDETAWKKPTISHEHLSAWNEISSGWQQPHKVVKISADEHWPKVDLHDGVFSYDSHKEQLRLSGDDGLHTHIISSSGHDFSGLSDKIDDGNKEFDEDGKHFIKSYG